jgi:ubiquinol-cytochrome c reductase cytochrome b subunit
VLILVLLCLLFLSGAVLVLYYTPAPGSAYDSVDFAQFNVPYGGVIRGVHHYAWNVLLIVLGLHLITEFLAASYKAGGRRAWTSGILVMMLMPLFVITGDLLPWDQRGYWSTQVRLSIIGSVPWIGHFLVQILQGGSLTGVVALTRFYVLHVLFLPCALVLLIALHAFLVMAGWRARSASGGANLRPSLRLFPAVVHRWLALFVVVAATLGVAAWLRPAPLADPADPADSAYVPRPEWWVLFLNQLVTVFKGRMAVVGTTLVPLGLIGFLFALPYLDRGPERHPGKRLGVVIVAALIAAALIGLSVAGYVEHHVGSRGGP